MAVEWGAPRQLEDYGVLICLFLFHGVFGALVVALRIPVYDFGGINTFISAGFMILVFAYVMTNVRRLQKWLFMSNRYPVSTFEATIGVADNTLSVVEWLTIVSGQYTGLALCWEYWLRFSMDAPSAVAEFFNPLSAAMVHTLLMSVALFRYHRCVDTFFSRHHTNDGISKQDVDHEPLLFLSIAMGVLAAVNAHFSHGTGPLFLGLTGIYQPSQHGAITLLVSTMLHATVHALCRLVTVKRNKQ